MVKSKIEWCDSTWSPVTGCYHGCEYCYARVTANRFKGCDISLDGSTDQNIVVLKDRLKVTSKEGVTRNAAYPYSFTPTLHEYRLNDPSTKGLGKNIFVCSMSDLFGSWVPDEWIEKVFDACKKADNHRYLFLTKNPDRYIQLAKAGKLPKQDNFWYGTTTTDPSMPFYWADEYNTFLSIEPILEPFGKPASNDLCKDVGWAIFGAETGNRKDKVVPKREWIADAVRGFIKAGTPVFMKDSMKGIWGDNLMRNFPWNDKNEDTD